MAWQKENHRIVLGKRLYQAHRILFLNWTALCLFPIYKTKQEGIIWIVKGSISFWYSDKMAFIYFFNKI
ncbi:MAG TPA: hypothetical protein DG754_07830 [Bacteroidales bacterium]|nr:hypothetical protein [Bacteroidales bacterium]